SRGRLSLRLRAVRVYQRPHAMAQTESLLQRRRFRSILSLGAVHCPGDVPQGKVMLRSLGGGVLGFVLLATGLPAQEEIQRGKIKKVDADRGTITITTGSKDLELVVAEETRIVISNKESNKGIKDAALKEGALVMFKAVEKDGKQVLAGPRVGGGGGPRDPGGDIRKAKVQKRDPDNVRAGLTGGEKAQEVSLTEQTEVLGAQGKDLKERLQGFKEGSAVMFKTEKREGKEVIVALKLDDGKSAPPREQPKADTSKLKPLTEMGTEEYQGFKGGLYPDGKNDRPAAHEAAGLALAKQIQPLDADGKPSADGKIVLLSVGMSNTTQEFSTFKRTANADREKNPKLVVVDGAQGGMTAFRIMNPREGTGERFWTTVDDRLKAGGVTRDQVQVAWIKE